MLFRSMCSHCVRGDVFTLCWGDVYTLCSGRCFHTAFGAMFQGISCGISFSVGVFFVEWLDVFDEAHDVTAWVGSLNTGLMFAIGKFI